MMRLKSTEFVKSHDASVNLGVKPGSVATLDGSRASFPIDPQELQAMFSATMNGVSWPEPCLTVPPQSDRERKQRILAAIGLNGQNLRVDQPSLARYYDHLRAHLELPFVACYPRPSTQAAVDRCEAIELLNPRTDPCDLFDGIYCQTRKGRFLVNLPLVELTALGSKKNLELLADYEYWFWHWRE